MHRLMYPSANAVMIISNCHNRLWNPVYHLIVIHDMVYSINDYIFVYTLVAVLNIWIC